jgi:hypothetical protein
MSDKYFTLPEHASKENGCRHGGETTDIEKIADKLEGIVHSLREGHFDQHAMRVSSFDVDEQLEVEAIQLTFLMWNGIVEPPDKDFNPEWDDLAGRGFVQQY